MEFRTKVRARAVVKDLRSGMGPTEIRGKYKLSDKGFQSVIRKLAAADLLKKAEVERFHKWFPGLFVGDLRQSPRTPVKILLIVCDANNPSSKGFVRDISKKGISVEGLEANVGDVRRLKILSSGIAGSSTFMLKAKCVWREGDGTPDKEPISGFEITSVTESAMNELKKLL
jgi:hypothetical protein